MNYSELALHVIEEYKQKDLKEVIYDRNVLLNMRNSGNIDMKILKSIHNKYKEEIDEIDKYRIQVFNNNVSNGLENILSYLDSLINHLYSIICLRYVKDYVDNEFKKELVTQDEKIVYELIIQIRDKKKYAFN